MSSRSAKSRLTYFPALSPSAWRWNIFLNAAMCRNVSLLDSASTAFCLVAALERDALGLQQFHLLLGREHGLEVPRLVGAVVQAPRDVCLCPFSPCFHSTRRVIALEPCVPESGTSTQRRELGRAIRPPAYASAPGRLEPARSHGAGPAARAAKTFRVKWATRLQGLPKTQALAGFALLPCASGRRRAGHVPQGEPEGGEPTRLKEV